MLYLPCLSIFWKTNIHIRICLHHYILISHCCQEQQSKRKEQRQKRLNSTHLKKKRKKTQIKPNSQAKYEKSYIWADSMIITHRETHPLTPFSLGYVLISSFKSEFLEPSRMKNHQSGAFWTKKASSERFKQRPFRQS